MTADFPFPFDSQTRADALHLIELALVEDVGSCDLTTAIDGTTCALFSRPVAAQAAFVARQSGIICGLQICQLAIEHFAPKLELKINVVDSQSVISGQTVALVSGEARDILVMERTCLNFLCHLSAISTLTHAFVERVAGTQAKILDTRKTMPGWRRVEKYAVKCGGGLNHRMGLYDAIMIKDNHLAMHARVVQDHELSITEAIRLARDWIEKNAPSLPRGDQTVLQIEVDNLEQLEIALASAPDIVLLDNMTPEQLTKAVEIRNQTSPGVLLEASGGINLETARTIAETGIERISVGALTHSAGNFDIGLDWQRG